MTSRNPPHEGPVRTPRQVTVQPQEPPPPQALPPRSPQRKDEGEKVPARPVAPGSRDQRSKKDVDGLESS
jgi:hypothetical protein